MSENNDATATPAAPAPAADLGGSLYRVAGILAVILGAGLCAFAATMRIAVTTAVPGEYSEILGEVIGTRYEQVVNLGLLQNQAMAFQAGLMLLLIATVLLVGAAVIDRLARPAEPTP